MLSTSTSRSWRRSTPRWHPEVTRMVQDNFLGNYTSCVAARSTNRGILAGSQDGGIATGTLAFALVVGSRDGAIVSVVGPSEPFKPGPIVATSPEELYMARGTK